MVDENGEMVGVIALADAVKRAEKAGMDLVEISPNAEPPVCKILDYGKYRFESHKKMKEAKKKQKVTQIKELKLRVNIGEHDYQVKMKQGLKFLESGDKVKVTLRFRGREMAHTNLAIDLFNRFFEDLSEIGKVELKPSMEGRQLIMIIVPQ